MDLAKNLQKFRYTHHIAKTKQLDKIRALIFELLIFSDVVQ